MGNETMADLPHPWGAFGHLQAELLRGRCINNQGWGTEAALNRILASLQDNDPPTLEEITRTAANERRRERHRARLRHIYLPANDAPPHPEDALAARQELRSIRAKVSARDWTILREMAFGCDYAEVASIVGGSPGSLRVRMLRLRQRLRARAGSAMDGPKTGVTGAKVVDCARTIGRGFAFTSEAPACHLTSEAS